MTKAEQLKKIKAEAIEKRDKETQALYKKYVNKIIDGKLRLCASLGYGMCSVKVRKKYSPSLTKSLLEEEGFEVTEMRKNGRSIFKIKW
jgi:hypothetical protein